MVTMKAQAGNLTQAEDLRGRTERAPGLRARPGWARHGRQTVSRAAPDNSAAATAGGQPWGEPREEPRGQQRLLRAC